MVEIKGGSIRIANSKTAQGAWDWKTVFVSGHIAAELVTAANLVAGRIQSANGTSYWNLDSNTLVTHDMTTYNMKAHDIDATGGSITGATIKSTGTYGEIITMDTGVIKFKHSASDRSTMDIKNTGLDTILFGRDNSAYVRVHAGSSKEVHIEAGNYQLEVRDTGIYLFRNSGSVLHSLATWT